MGEPRRKLNRYTCQVCRCSIVTEDIDDGVTPFSIPCTETVGCSGAMLSAFYRGSSAVKPVRVWRKPTKAELEAASPAAREHYGEGGLILSGRR